MTKASDLLVAALENEGVEYIFAIPGEENLDVLELLRRSRIKLVLTRHEQAAGFMAATYGRLTGRAGVCLTTLGPGALNLTTAAAYAHLGAMPMVMITGQKAIRSSQQARFHICPHRRDHAAADQDGDANRFCDKNPDPGPRRLPGCAAGAAGPVHLELPEDIAPTTPRLTSSPMSSNFPSPLRPLSTRRTMIMAASRPLVMLGAAASRPYLADRCRRSCDDAGFHSSTPRWGRARSMPALTCIWVRLRCRSGIGFTRPSTKPI